MKLKTGDKVIVLSGKDKGKTGVITRVLPAAAKVIVEGVNEVKRAYKPSPANPKGGIKTELRPLWASKLAIINPTNPKRGSRIGFKLDKAGKKVRIYRADGNEIKDKQ